MKRFSFLMLAAAGLLFNACSDDTVVAEGGGQGEALSEGYIALAINLPTTSGTRAANDVFDDGDAKEYQVNSCALLFFEGSTEAGATLFSAQNVLMKDLDQTDDIDNDNVTTTYQYVTKVSGRTTTGGMLYALALLNYDKVMSFDTDGIPTFKSVRNTTGESYGEIKLSVGENGSTLSDISAFITNLTLDQLIGSNKDNFFMTNAVLSTTPGGSVGNPANNVTGTDGTTTTSKRFQLAELDPKKIYDTEDKAKRNPAGEIFVERAVAKATLSLQDGYTNNTGLQFGEITWALDNMEPTTYVVRNPGDQKYISYTSDGFDDAYYRFVSHTPTTVSTALVSNPFYRTYWCMDPQYNDDNMPEDPVGKTPKQYNSKNMLEHKEGTFFGRGITNPQYCFENTFDVKHQSYRNTTRAIIKVELAGEKTDFYTVNGGSEIYTEENAISLVIDQIIKSTDVETIFKDNLKDDAEYEITAGEEGDFVFTFETNDETGQHELTGVTLTNKVFNANVLKEDNTLRSKIEELFKVTDGKYNDNEIISNANNSIVIFHYEGVMYYEARFQHFAGDSDDPSDAIFDSAPWNTWEPEGSKPTTGFTSEAYPGLSEKNYLGRYGMVRNNWYDVEVTAFKNIGYPKVPSVKVKNPGYDDPDTPDDKLKENIAVKIHVLSWAMRKQSWSF